jgi:hypothetical protein
MRVTELEDANASLQVELEAARSKLAEVERRERTLTSENEGLKRDLEGAHSAHEAAVKDKELVRQTKQSKLWRFQDSVHKRLAELRGDIEASVSALGGQSAEFPSDASLSDFFKWFQMEIKSMPTTFVECNKNITCYALIGIFQMLAGEGCEHMSELRKLAHSYDASVLQNFPVETGCIAKRLVKNWWNVHGLPYCKRKIEEENRVSFIIYYLRASLCATYLTCFFFSSLKLMKVLEVTAPARALKRAETTCGQRLLWEGPPQLKLLVMTQRRM